MEQEISIVFFDPMIVIIVAGMIFLTLYYCGRQRRARRLRSGKIIIYINRHVSSFVNAIAVSIIKITTFVFINSEQESV